MKWLAPRPGMQYRDTVTKQLVPATGFAADPNDLDIARALGCGDLVEAEEPAPAEPGSAADDPPAAEPAAEEPAPDAGGKKPKSGPAE